MEKTLIELTKFLIRELSRALIMLNNYLSGDVEKEMNKLIKTWHKIRKGK